MAIATEYSCTRVPPGLYTHTHSRGGRNPHLPPPHPPAAARGADDQPHPPQMHTRLCSIHHRIEHAITPPSRLASRARRAISCVAYRSSDELRMEAHKPRPVLAWRGARVQLHHHTLLLAHACTRRFWPALGRQSLPLAGSSRRPHPG